MPMALCSTRRIQPDVQTVRTFYIRSWATSVSNSISAMTPIVIETRTDNRPNTSSFSRQVACIEDLAKSWIPGRSACCPSRKLIALSGRCLPPSFACKCVSFPSINRIFLFFRIQLHLWIVLPNTPNFNSVTRFSHLLPLTIASGLA